jgi:hypothetical protein
MAGMFAYTCSCCGKHHEGSPSFCYAAPLYYEQLTNNEKNLATLSGDLCKIGHPEGTHYFARVVLEIPIDGVNEPFSWGVWVSLSEASFERYTSTWNDHDESDSYFGWFSNRLPYYPDTTGLKTQVRPRKGGIRPYLVLEETEHPLAMHFHNGITIQEAQKIAEIAMHGS